MERVAPPLVKILLIAGIVPFRTHGTPGVTAAHIVTHALLSEFQARGHQVSLQCIFHQSRSSGQLSEPEKAEFEYLKSKGVTVTDPIFLSDHFARRPEKFRSLRMLFSLEKAITHFYPGYALRSVMAERVAQTGCDVVVPVWAPQGVAAMHGLDVPCVAYHGDIDYEPGMCRLLLDKDLFGSGTGFLRGIDNRLRLASYKRAHLALMKQLAGIANVTANNALFYERLGHPLSVYVHNTWINTPALPPATRSPNQPIKIIGHTGSLDRTGGTYGLQFLLKDVVPALDMLLQGKSYEVHIIGGGKMMPSLQSAASHPNVKLRGFVEDIDSELQSADVVCVLNNAGRYKAAYTRHLVAWQSKLCLIAHRDSTQAMPEIEHEKNALLGSTGKEVAEQIVRAATDSALSQKVREGGYQTFTQCFTPAIVAGNIEEVLKKAVSRS